MEENSFVHFPSSSCILDFCDERATFACPHCLEFVCDLHVADHNCCQLQLQVACSRDKLPQMQEEAPSYSPPEILLMLVHLSFTWLYYVKSKSNEPHSNTLISGRNTYNFFSLWKYIYDNECRFLNTFESGIPRFKYIWDWTRREEINKWYEINKQKNNMFNRWKAIKKYNEWNKIWKEIKVIKDSIDSFGNHWLFLIDGFTLEIWRIGSKEICHLKHEILKIKSSVSQVNIALNKEILFVIRGNFVEAYAFQNPNYILKPLYSFFCDEPTKMKDVSVESVFYSGSRVRNFIVHVLDNAIVGHAGFTETGIVGLHIWDPKTGNKINVVYFQIPSSTDVRFVYVNSKIYDSQCDILLNASVRFNDETEKTYLFATNISNAITQASAAWLYNNRALWLYNKIISPSLAMSDYNDLDLQTPALELPSNIVYCGRISKNEIIICRQKDRMLKFSVFRKNGKHWDDVGCNYATSFNRRTIFPNFKIHVFEKLGLLVVAVNDCKIQVVDLSCLLQGQVIVKRFCYINDVRKVHFLCPKYVVVMCDKIGMCEIFNAEAGQFIKCIGIPKGKMFKVTWPKTTLVPPHKLIISDNQKIKILYLF